MFFSARVGEGEGAEASSSINFGRPGALLAAQWHLARAVGKRFRECRAKRLYVHNLHLLMQAVAIQGEMLQRWTVAPWRVDYYLALERKGLLGFFRLRLPKECQ